MIRWGLLALCACGGPGDTASTQLTSPQTSPATLDQALVQRGFQVQEGLFFVSTLEGCCDVGANCYGNNTATPYGTPVVPPAPGDVIDFVDTVDDWGALPTEDLSRSWRMRSDEAILLTGPLPPRAKYFSYRSYLGERVDDVFPQLGSLGPSLNNLVIAAQLGTEDIWGEEVAIITSANADTEADVRQALVDVGWQADHIFGDRIDSGWVNFGLESDKDRLFAVMRTAVYDDEDRGLAWLADPGWTVLRLTPDQVRAASAHPPAQLATRGTGTDESEWAAAVVALGLAIHGTYAGVPFMERANTVYWPGTLSCLDTEPTCGGDIHDRLVLTSGTFTVDSDDDFAVAYGVNHQRTGKAIYSNIAVQTWQTQSGIDDRNSIEMAGSARFWLPDHPLADDLYAYLIARDCTGRTEPCIEVPTDTCPGARIDELLKVSVRAYLEPTTGAAPLETELIHDRVIKFEPKIQ